MSDMTPTMVSGFAVVVIAIIVVLIAFAYYSARKRAEELFALAMQMKMEFSANDPFDIPAVYNHCHKFNEGHSRKVSNVIYGRAGDCDVKTCDYRYETGSGDSEQKHSLSFVILDTPYFFPYMIVRPEMFTDRIAAFVGMADINFESEEFSRRFYVKSDNKKFVYDVIHPRMMEFLLSEPSRTIELLGRSIVIYTGSVFEPQEFSLTIMFGGHFLELFPDYLKNQLRSAQEVT